MNNYILKERYSIVLYFECKEELNRSVTPGKGEESKTIFLSRMNSDKFNRFI